MSEEMIKCRVCGEYKPLDQMKRHHGHTSGYDNICLDPCKRIEDDAYGCSPVGVCKRLIRDGRKRNGPWKHDSIEEEKFKQHFLHQLEEINRTHGLSNISVGIASICGGPRPRDFKVFDELGHPRMKLIIKKRRKGRKITSAVTNTSDIKDCTSEDFSNRYVPDHRDTRIRKLKKTSIRYKKFRKNAAKLHGGIKCQISGLDASENKKLAKIVEACHIYPRRGRKDDDPTNCLLLRRDIHTLFDLDLIGICPNTFTVHAHPDIMSIAVYSVLHGQRLLCDTNKLSKNAMSFRWNQFLQKLNAK